MAAFMEGSGIEARNGNFCTEAGLRTCLETITSHQGTFPYFLFSSRHKSNFPTEPPAYANDYYANSIGIVTDSFLERGLMSSCPETRNFRRMNLHLESLFRIKSLEVSGDSNGRGQ